MTIEQNITAILETYFCGFRSELIEACAKRIMEQIERQADTPQTEVGYCAESQPRCPKCGKRGYIRSLESMGVKLKVFDEYKWKCTNCNKYFKEEPKDEPQTEKIKTHDYCDICNHKGCDNCIANNLDDYCVPSGYAPKDTPQTEREGER